MERKCKVDGCETIEIRKHPKRLGRFRNGLCSRHSRTKETSEEGQNTDKYFYDALDRVAKMESAKIDQKYIYDMLNEAVEEYNIATARTTDIPTFSGPYFPPKGKVLWLIFFRYFLLIALGILLTLAYFKFFYVIHTNVLGDLVLTRKW
jgi:hypothetical protein